MDVLEHGRYNLSSTCGDRLWDGDVLPIIALYIHFVLSSDGQCLTSVHHTVPLMYSMSLLPIRTDVSV